MTDEQLIEEYSKEMNSVIDGQTEKIKGLEAEIKLQKMLIDVLEKNNKELTDAQMEHQVKVGELEYQVEKLKDEVDYWRRK